MNTYTIYWLDKKTSEVRGTDIADAFRRAGIGHGALPAVDYYAEHKPCNQCSKSLPNLVRCSLCQWEICQECADKPGGLAPGEKFCYNCEDKNERTANNSR